MKVTDKGLSYLADGCCSDVLFVSLLESMFNVEDVPKRVSSLFENLFWAGHYSGGEQREISLVIFTRF